MVSIILFLNLVSLVGLVSLAVGVRLYAMKQKERSLFNSTEEGLQKVREIAQEYTQRVELLNADAQTAERNASNIAKKISENYTQLRQMHNHIENGQKIIETFNQNAESLAEVFPMAKQTQANLQKLLEESKEHSKQLDNNQERVQQVINACVQQEGKITERIKQSEENVNILFAKEEEKFNAFLHAFNTKSIAAREQLDEVCHSRVNESLEDFESKITQQVEWAQSRFASNVEGKEAELELVFEQIKSDANINLEQIREGYDNALNEVQNQTGPVLESLEQIKQSVNIEHEGIREDLNSFRNFIDDEHKSIKEKNIVIQSEVSNVENYIKEHKEIVQSELQKSGDEVINLWKEELQGRKKGLEDYAQNFENQLTSVYQEHSHSMKEVFETLKAQLQQENEGRLTTFKSDYDSLFNQVSSYCLEKQSSIKEFHSKLIDGLTSLSEDAAQETNAYKDELDDAKAKIERSTEEHLQIISISEQKAQEIIAEHNKYLETQLQKVSNTNTDKLKDLEEMLILNANESRSSIDESKTQIEALLASHQEELQQSLEHNRALEQEQIILSKQEIVANANECRSSIDESKKELESLLASYQEELQKRIEHNRALEQEQITLSQETLKERLVEYQSKINGMEQQVEHSIETHAKHLETILAQVKIEYKEKIDILQSDYNDMISEIEQRFGDADVNFDNKQRLYLEKIEEFENNIEEFERKKTEIMNEVLQSNDEMIDTYKNEIQEHITTIIEEQYKQNIEQIKTLTEDANNNLLSKAEVLENSLREKVNLINKDIDETGNVVDLKLAEVMKTLDAAEETIDKKLDTTQEKMKKADSKLKEKVILIEDIIAKAENKTKRAVDDMNESVSRVAKKHINQAKLIEDDTIALKKLEDISVNAQLTLEKTERNLNQLRSKYGECDMLTARLDNLKNQVEDFSKSFEKVKAQDGKIKSIMREHDKLTKQISKIETRTNKIDNLLTVLESKEERIKELKLHLTDIQIAQKDINDYKKEIDESLKHYKVAFDNTDELEKRIVAIEQDSNSISQKLLEQSDKAEETNKTLKQIEGQKAEVNKIAENVAGVISNIPLLNNKIKDIENSKEDFIELENRLQKISKETSKKIRLLSLVSEPNKKRSSETKLDSNTKTYIQELYGEYKYSVEKLAELYNISVREVQNIVDQAYV